MGSGKRTATCKQLRNSYYDSRNSRGNGKGFCNVLAQIMGGTLPACVELLVDHKTKNPPKRVYVSATDAIMRLL